MRLAAFDGVLSKKTLYWRKNHAKIFYAKGEGKDKGRQFV